MACFCCLHSMVWSGLVWFGVAWHGMAWRLDGVKYLSHCIACIASHRIYSPSLTMQIVISRTFHPPHTLSLLLLLPLPQISPRACPSRPCKISSTRLANFTSLRSRTRKASGFRAPSRGPPRRSIALQACCALGLKPSSPLANRLTATLAWAV
jgi:hypothetical protein